MPRRGSDRCHSTTAYLHIQHPPCPLGSCHNHSPYEQRQMPYCLMPTRDLQCIPSPSAPDACAGSRMFADAHQTWPRCRLALDLPHTRPLLPSPQRPTSSKLPLTINACAVVGLKNIGGRRNILPSGSPVAMLATDPTRLQAHGGSDLAQQLLRASSSHSDTTTMSLVGAGLGFRATWRFIGRISWSYMAGGPYPRWQRH